MGGTARRNGPCAVSWAEVLAHGTAGTAARRGTAQCRASTARPCRVPCRHGTVANYSHGRLRKMMLGFEDVLTMTWGCSKRSSLAWEGSRR